MTKWQIALGIIVSALVIVATMLRLAHSIYRFARSQETTQSRLGTIEAQLVPNGHSQPGDRDKSARDMLDQIHSVAMANAEANARVEAEQRRAARVAGEAAQAAATARQEATDARRGVNALRAEVDVMMNAVLDDHAGLWGALASLDPRLDRRRGDHDTSTDPTV